MSVINEDRDWLLATGYPRARETGSEHGPKVKVRVIICSRPGGQHRFVSATNKEKKGDASHSSASQGPADLDA